MERRKRNCIAFKQHWEHMRRWCVVVISCELAARQPQHSATQILDFGLSTVHVVRMYVSWHVYSFHFLFFSFYFVYRFSMQVLFFCYESSFNMFLIQIRLFALCRNCQINAIPLFNARNGSYLLAHLNLDTFLRLLNSFLAFQDFCQFVCFFFLLCDSFSFWTVENGGKVQWRIWWRA